MELSRISRKHRGSSTRPTKNFRETCFTYTTNAQWHYVAPTLAWQYHFISCEGIQLGICFTLKGEDVVKHFQKKFRCDGWQLEDFLWGMKTRSKPAQVKHELLLSWSSSSYLAPCYYNWESDSISKAELRDRCEDAIDCISYHCASSYLRARRTQNCKVRIEMRLRCELEQILKLTPFNANEQIRE